MTVGSVVVRGEFWNGADVRWVGPDVDLEGAQLRRGTRAIVVDAGRHHVASFGSLTSRSSRRIRPGRGVVIRVAPDWEVRVPARHLELVAPDHPLRPEPDGTVADWWRGQLEDAGPRPTVSAFVPHSLPAVCRVLHPWRDRHGMLSWREVADRFDLPDRAELARRVHVSDVGAVEPFWSGHLDGPEEGELDQGLAANLVDLLGNATTTPADVLFAVWEGWGDVPPARFPGAARLATRSRGHFLLRGPLGGALTSVSAVPVRKRPVSGIWWPADRAWFLHTEIDFPWTFLAGGHDLLEEAARRVEAIATTFDAPPHRFEETDGPRGG